MKYGCGRVVSSNLEASDFRLDSVATFDAAFEEMRQADGFKRYRIVCKVKLTRDLDD